jgi:hypothetical protein
VTPSLTRPGRLDLDFPTGFTGPATILTCEALYFADECPAQSLQQLWLEFGAVEATGDDGASIDRLTMCPARFDCSEWPCLGEPGPYVAAVCGDPNADGSATATDALIALQAAVGVFQCLPEQCDTDDNGAITASDAFRILMAALGLDVELRCPFPCDSRVLTAGDDVAPPPLPDSPPPAFAVVLSADRGSGVPGTVFQLAVEVFANASPIHAISWTVDEGEVVEEGTEIELSFDEPGEYSIAVTVEEESGSIVTTGTIVRVFDPEETPPQIVSSISPAAGIPGTLVRIEAPALTDPEAVVRVSVGDGEPFEPHRPQLGAANFVIALDAAAGLTQSTDVAVLLFVNGAVTDAFEFLLEPPPTLTGEPGVLLRAWLSKGPDLADAAERELIAAVLGLDPDATNEELALLQALLRFVAGRLVQIDAALSPVLDRLDDAKLAALDQALLANGATAELLGRVSGSVKRPRAVGNGNDELIANLCRFHDINRALIAVARAGQSAATLLQVLSLQSILSAIAAAEPIAVQLGLDAFGLAGNLVDFGVIADVLTQLDALVPDVRDELEVTATPSVLRTESERATVRVRAFLDDPTQICTRSTDELLRDLSQRAAERVLRLAASGAQAWSLVARSLFGGPSSGAASPQALAQFQNFLADVIDAITSTVVSAAGLDALLAEIRERLCAQSSGAGLLLRPDPERFSIQPPGAGSFGNLQEESVQFACGSGTNGQVTLRVERGCGARADGAGPRILTGQVRVTCGKETCTESALGSLAISQSLGVFDRPSPCGFLKETLDLRIADVFFQNTHPTRTLALAVIGIQESDKQSISRGPCEDIGNFSSVEECVERIAAGCNTPPGLFLSPGQKSTFGHLLNCRREELFNPEDGSSSGTCGDLEIETITGHVLAQAVYCDDFQTAQEVFCARAHQQLVRFGLPAPEFGSTEYAPQCGP